MSCKVVHPESISKLQTDKKCDLYFAEIGALATHFPLAVITATFSFYYGDVLAQAALG